MKKKTLLLIVVCTIFLFTGCFGAKSTKNETKEIVVKINNISGIDAKYKVTANDELVMSVTNNEDDLIDYLSIDIAMYDAENNLIKTEKQYARNLLKGYTSYSKTVTTLSAIDDEEAEAPARIEVAFNKTIYSTKVEELYTDKVTAEVVDNKETGEVTATFVNNSGTTISNVEGAIVFYKNDSIVDIQQVALVNVEGTASVSVGIPLVVDADGIYNLIEYDKVEVVVSNASTIISN